MNEEKENNNKSSESAQIVTPASSEIAVEPTTPDVGQLGSITSTVEGGNNVGILNVEKDLDKDERMLPIHFLPEGRKAYDWINQDLKNDDQLEEKKKSLYRTM